MMRRFIRDIIWLIQARLMRKKKLVCFGTSLTEGSGWVKMLQKELPEYHVINFGKGGANSNWGVDNLKWVLRFKPEIVLMEFAINDAFTTTPYCRPVKSFTESYLNIVRMIKTLRLKGIKVYYLGMNPPYDVHTNGRNPAQDRPEYWRFRRQHENIMELFKVPYIDITAVWESIDTTIVLGSYIVDGLHPNEKASRDITVPTIMKVLNKSVWRIKDKIKKDLPEIKWSDEEINRAINKAQQDIFNKFYP